MSYITVEQLYKIFGKRPLDALAWVKDGANKEQLLAKGYQLALSQVNLSIGKGEIFVIMGLSGSGKSTLIRHFNRLIDPTCGKIFIDNTEVTALKQRDLECFRQKMLAMVFQKFALMPHKTVLENIAYGLEIQNVRREERLTKAHYWLERVALRGYEKHYPATLSGGQQQRVGIARALCVDTPIILMDEPFSALDPLIRSQMQDELMGLQDELKKTIVFITHDLDEAVRLGNKIAMLKDGEVVQCDTPEQILKHPANEYVKAFVAGAKK